MFELPHDGLEGKEELSKRSLEGGHAVEPLMKKAKSELMDEKRYDASQDRGIRGHSCLGQRTR